MSKNLPSDQNPERAKTRSLRQCSFVWTRLASLVALPGLLAVALAISINLSFTPIASAQSIGEADELLIKNRFKEAEDAYRGLLESDDSGDAYAGLAVALAKQGWPSKILEAERVLRQAQQKFPDNPNVIAAGGYVSFIHSKTIASPAKRDLYIEATEMLCKRAIKANPDILIAQQTLGLVKVAQDDIDGSIEPLRKSLILAENPMNFTLLAASLLKLDPKDKEGEELITKALQLKPDYAPARMQKAIVLSAQGKNEDAFMELHNIPNSERTPEWSAVEGDIYKKQGDGPAALASWKEATRLDPHNPEPYKSMAEYHTMRGDAELAIGEMHDALEILPNDMKLRAELAELALRQDKLDVAETEYKTILDTQPDDANAILGLSRVAFRKARRDQQYPPDWQKLMDRLQNVIAEKSATQQTVKGEVLKPGSKTQAKALQENIKLSEAEKALMENRFRDARALFISVITEHKDDPYNLLTLGEQAFNDGDLRSAEHAYSLAKEIPEVAPRAEQGMSRIVTQRNEALRQTKLGDAMWKVPDVAIDHYNQGLIADPQYPSAFYGRFCLRREDQPELASKDALCFLEAADDSDSRRQEVESSLVKLKKHGEKKKSK